MADDLHTRLREAVAAQLSRARRMERMAQEYQLEVQEPRLWGKQVPGWGEWPEVERMAQLLAQHCERDLRVLERHRAQFFAWCGVCRTKGNWPCRELREMAVAYALATEEVNDTVTLAADMARDRAAGLTPDGDTKP